MKKMKLKLTKKQYLAIDLSLVFVLISAYIALCIDASYLVMSSKNPIALIREAIGLPEIEANGGTWILTGFVLVYIALFVISFSYIKAYFRKADKFEKNKFYLYSAVDCFVCLVLSFGLGTLFQLPFGTENIATSYSFLFEVIALGLIFFLIIVLVVYVIVSVYRLLKSTDKVKIEDGTLSDINGFTSVGEANLSEGAGETIANSKGGVSSNYPVFGLDSRDLSLSLEDSSASIKSSSSQEGGVSSTSSVMSSGEIISNIDTSFPKKEQLFTKLTSIDNKYESDQMLPFEKPSFTLADFLSNLQIYLAKKDELYYEKKELAEFIAALAGSKLIILEGISGTGKSSLPRYFAKFISSEAYFEPVQVTYKEKSDLLGYYNEFTKKYNETDFLSNLYEASFKKDLLNMVVLDEMNISRVEYYFADFLSVMEYPEDEQRITLMQLADNYDGPKNLKEGKLKLTPNTYFIGTCNKDDSTYTVTDKVIDRAIVIDFDGYHNKVDYKEEPKEMFISYSELQYLFKQAQSDEKKKFDSSDREKFRSVLNELNESFSIAIGNRILQQIEDMAPVYVDLGFKKEDCLDLILANKILRKLDSRFDTGLKRNLMHLEDTLSDIYGNKSFEKSRKKIKELLRRL